MVSSNNAEGHRRRLREKFLKSGLSGFHDYEIVELLLTLGSPRKDCKEPAKEALKRFKTLQGVLSTSLEELQEISGIGPVNAFGIKLVQEVAREFLKERIINQPVLQSPKDIFDYLYHSMRDLDREKFKVIYLDGQNRIIDTEDLFEGTVNTTAIYPREVMKSAIKHNAVGLLFAHNHPSGDPAPSNADKQLTRDLVYAGSVMQLRVLDHLIIGGNRYFSFAEDGLISKFEVDFLGQKRG
jgi:DNA repair protein RadC